MLYVPRALRTLVSHMPRAVRALVPHVLFAPQALVPHVSCALRFSCLTYLVPYLLSCSCVSCLACSCTSLCVLVYLAQHTLMHAISRSSCVLYLLCFCCFRYLSFFPVWATVNDYDMQLPLIYIYLITLIYQTEFVRKELWHACQAKLEYHSNNTNTLCLLKNREKTIKDKELKHTLTN